MNDAEQSFSVWLQALVAIDDFVETSHQFYVVAVIEVEEKKCTNYSGETRWNGSISSPTNMWNLQFVLLKSDQLRGPVDKLCYAPIVLIVMTIDAGGILYQRSRLFHVLAANSSVVGVSNREKVHQGKRGDLLLEARLDKLLRLAEQCGGFSV